jgi:hypothetical protein
MKYNNPVLIIGVMLVVIIVIAGFWVGYTQSYNNSKALSNFSSDFVVNKDNVLVRYRGFPIL